MNTISIKNGTIIILIIKLFSFLQIIMKNMQEQKTLGDYERDILKTKFTKFRWLYYQNYFNRCKKQHQCQRGIQFLSKYKSQLGRFSNLFIVIFYIHLNQLNEAKKQLQGIGIALQDQCDSFQEKYMNAWFALMNFLQPIETWKQHYQQVKKIMGQIKSGDQQRILLCSTSEFLQKESYQFSYFLIGELIELSEKNPYYEMLRVQVLMKLKRETQACIVFHQFCNFQKGFTKQRVQKIKEQKIYNEEHLTKAKNKFDRLKEELKGKIVQPQKLEQNYNKIRDKNRQYCCQMLVYTQILIQKYRRINYVDKADDIQVLQTNFRRFISKIKTGAQFLNNFISEFPIAKQIGHIIEAGLKQYLNISNQLMAQRITNLFLYCETNMQKIVMQMVIHLFEGEQMLQLLKKQKKQLGWYQSIFEKIENICKQFKQFMFRIVSYLQGIGSMEDQDQQINKQIKKEKTRLRLLAQHHCVQIFLTMIKKYSDLIQLVDLFERPLIFGVKKWKQNKKNQKKKMKEY